MKPLITCVKTTLIGGLLFLIPLVLVVLLVQQALHLVGSALAPITHLLPTQTVVGFAVAQVVAVCALLCVCFVAGLAIRTRTGARQRPTGAAQGPRRSRRCACNMMRR
jgi:hypothetical protein